MAGNLHILRPGEPPLVVAASLVETNPEFRNSMRYELGPGSHFLTDRYWLFTQDPRAEAATAIGRLVFGVINSYPEFSGIGITSGSIPLSDGEATRDGAFFALTMSAQTGALYPGHIYPDKTDAALVAATNESLLALNSPYNLPLGIAES